MKNIKIALIYDFFVYPGGAERVFNELRNIYPSANIFTLFLTPDYLKKSPFLKNIKTSFLQKLPNFLKNRYKYFLPLLPTVIESLDLRDYDLIISSGGWSKGVVPRVKALHINYCHAPLRFLWDYTHKYFKEYKVKPTFFKKILIHYLRLWDSQASARPDYLIANSNWTKERIKKFYRRNSTVIYPPVDIKKFRSASENIDFKSEDYFLIVSRLTPYKRIDIAIEAFNKLKLPLIIIGDGSEKKRLKNMIKSPLIKMLGWISEDSLIKYYAKCYAYLQPAEEDFGISMVEAMAAGKPVLSLRSGGALEIIKEGENGEFFDDCVPEVLADGIRRLRENYNNYNKQSIILSVEKFSIDNFRNNFKNFVSNLI